MRFRLSFQVVCIANVVAGRHGSSKQESTEISNDQVASNKHYDREAKVHNDSQEVDGSPAIDVAEAGQSKAADYDTDEEGRTEQPDINLGLAEQVQLLEQIVNALDVVPVNAPQSHVFNAACPFLVTFFPVDLSGLGNPSTLEDRLLFQKHEAVQEKSRRPVGECIDEVCELLKPAEASY